MNDKYILVDGHPTPCHDMKVWGEWMEKMRKDRLVKREAIGDFYISTVFLGLDHNFYDDGPPLLYETMVFPAKDGRIAGFGDIDMERYSTKEEALLGHKKMVEKYKNK